MFWFVRCDGETGSLPHLLQMATPETQIIIRIFAPDPHHLFSMDIKR